MNWPQPKLEVGDVVRFFVDPQPYDMLHSVVRIKGDTVTITWEADNTVCTVSVTEVRRDPLIDIKRLNGLARTRD